VPFLKVVVVVVVVSYFWDELITYVNILSTLNLRDITSKFRTVAMLVFVGLRIIIERNE
jgi:hypothetical protein